MRFTVFVVGDKLEKFYLEAVKEYEKRLGRYCDIKLIHIKKEEQLQGVCTIKCVTSQVNGNTDI